MKKAGVLLISGLCLIHVSIYSQQSQGSIIYGKITDESGEPLSGAGVKIQDTYIGTYSNAGGDYKFEGLRDGSYILNISFLGYETQSHEVLVSGKASLDVKMKQSLLLAGEVIVNATRAGARAPLAYSVIEKGILKGQNSGQDLPFLLSLTPSLVETSEAGNGIGYTNLRIRGTDASRINVTFDGIPLNDPESQQVFWVDIPDLASSVENIQVQRGIGTSSNGSGAFGATVSIQSQNPDNEPFAQISTSAGSFNTYKTMISAGTGLLADRLAFQLRLSDIKSDGFIDRTGSDHRSAFLSGVYRTEKSHLKANIILGEEHTGIGWWGVPEEVLKSDRRYNPAGEYTDEQGVIKYYENETDNYVQNHYQLLFSHKISGDVNFSLALHYTRGEGYYEEYREDRSFSEYGLPDINIGGTAISETDLVRRKWMSNNFYGIVYSLRYRKDRLEATLGGGANYYSGNHFGKIIWMRHSDGLDKDFQWYLNTGLKGDISIYGKADYLLNDKISVFGDIQFRFIDYKMNGIDDDFRNLDQKHQYGFINPKAGLFVNITPRQDAYISFSLANREPTRSDFKEAAGDSGSTPRPETLYDTELGYKIRGNNYSFSANTYLMFYKDQLVPTGELSNTGYTIMTNVKKSSRTGVELSASIKPWHFFSWDASVTLSRNKIRDFVEYYIDYNTSDWSEEYKSKYLGTVDIAYSPSVTGSGDMNFIIGKYFQVHFINKYVGKQFFDNTMNKERSINPYFTGNLRIDIEPVIPWIKRTEFQLLINNIFNAVYESNAYGGNWYEDGIEQTWSYYFPQAGINFMMRGIFTF